MNFKQNVEKYLSEMSAGKFYVGKREVCKNSMGQWEYCDTSDPVKKGTVVKDSLGNPVKNPKEVAMSKKLEEMAKPFVGGAIGDYPEFLEKFLRSNRNASITDVVKKLKSYYTDESKKAEFLSDFDSIINAKRGDKSIAKLKGLRLEALVPIVARYFYDDYTNPKLAK